MSNVSIKSVFERFDLEIHGEIIIKQNIGWKHLIQKRQVFTKY